MNAHEAIRNPEQPNIESQAFRAMAEAVRTAGGYSIRFWDNPTNLLFDSRLQPEIEEKELGVADYAGIVDRQSEVIMDSEFLQNPCLAQINRIGEESGVVPGNSAYANIKDGLDGTAAFNAGLRPWAHLLAVLREGTPVMGAVAMPAMQLTLLSRKGHGVWMLHREQGPVRLGNPDRQEILNQPQKFVIYDYGNLVDPEQYARVGEMQFSGTGTREVAYTVTPGSAAQANVDLILSFGARRNDSGRRGVLGHAVLGPKMWDVAPTSLMVETLGGIVTDMMGNPLNWTAWSQSPESRQSYVASTNERDHTRILELLSRSGLTQMAPHSLRINAAERSES